MSLIQLVYASRPFGFDEAVLNGILIEARRNNMRDGITGALICRADIYLQLLEGEDAAVDAAFARIAHDDRHLEIRTLIRDEVARRLFPEWAMRDDPAKSWMWTQREVAEGAVSNASTRDIVAIFGRLASEPPSVRAS